MLEVTDLTKSFGRGGTAHTAIDRVSLAVAQGELVSIVGPSGCGKSTLLRCVGGLIAPTAGRVVLRGVPVHDVPDGLAVVLQDYGRSLYPWLSVRDNVAMPLRRTTRGRRRAEGRPTPRSRRSGCPVSATSTRGSSPAACSSGSPSPAPSRASRCCC